MFSLFMALHDLRWFKREEKFSPADPECEEPNEWDGVEPSNAI